MTNNQSRLVNNQNRIADCSICLRDIYFGTERTTPCNHIFHRICLETWLNRSPTCPLCRARLPRPEDDDSDATDAEDEGMVVDEFDIFLYLCREMLPLFAFFRAICVSRFPNTSENTMQRLAPGLFQMMMDVLPQVEFDLVIDDNEGWFERQEVINAFLQGSFDNEAPARAYVFDADYDPSMHRMISIYESFINYTGYRGHTYDSYVLFEEFLDRLNQQEQYLLFRTRQYQAVFRRLGIRRN